MCKYNKEILSRELEIQELKRLMSCTKDVNEKKEIKDCIWAIRREIKKYEKM